MLTQSTGCEPERSCCASLNCISGVQGDGEVHIDPEYRRLSRERHQAAATKTRLMRVIEDPRSATVARNPVPIQIQIGGKRKARACHFSSAEGDCFSAGSHDLALFAVDMTASTFVP